MASTNTGRSKRQIKSLLQTHNTNVSDMNRKLEGWVSSSKDNRDLFVLHNEQKKVNNLINSAQLTQRSSVIESKDHRNANKIQRDMFYNDEAMLKMNLNNFEDIYANQNQFDMQKAMNEMSDSKRPRLTNDLLELNSRDNSQDSSLQ